MSDAYPAIRRHGFADVLRENRRSRPNELAAVDEGLRLTFTELDARVNQLVDAMKQRGAKAGDRLLWLGQNSVKLFEVLLAGAKMGALVCPANWRMSVEEIRATVADWDPKFVFWQEAETGDSHRSSRDGWNEGRFWVQHDGTDHDSYTALLASGKDIDDELSVDPELPLLGIYTAGFSGRPAASLLSHTALLLQGMTSARGQAIDEHTRYLVSGPMFHVGVLMGAFGTYVSGGTLVFVPRANAGEMARLISNERVTHAFIPRPLVAGMAEAAALEKLDLSSLFAKPDLGDWEHPAVMPKHAPQGKNRGGYGQTEIGGLAVQAWLGGQKAGRPNPFMQIEILDDDGKKVPPGTVGEIVARGAMVMCGYWNRPEENARRTRDGWHRTHDLGRREPDGSIVFIGPKTTMIKSGIENIYPAEVEACIRLHAAVEDVCIIGIPDPEWDQSVKAVVVLRRDATLTLDDLAEHCKQRIASYKKPKVLALVTALPKNGAGFVDRAAVDAGHGGGGYPKVG